MHACRSTLEDPTARLAGDAGAPRLRPTRGIHLVTAGRGAEAALLLLHPRDGRVFFVIPWQGRTLVGTTDTETDESPDAVVVTPQEVAYLLEGYNHYLQPPLTGADLLACFAGLRPLLRDEADEPSSRSRDFRIVTSPSGLLSVAGGKYTTYRQMAQAATDVVMRRLGRRQRCLTRSFRLDGAPPGPWAPFKTAQVAALTAQGLAPRSACHLVQRYGRRTAEVAAYAVAEPALARAVAPGEPDVLAEFAYQREYEMAVYAVDCLLRRTRLGLFHPELLPADSLEPSAGLIATSARR